MIELPLFLCIKEQNMKILILEDNLSRQEFFKVNLEKHNLTITDLSKIAIEKLSTEKWDILFLDHDLGGEVHVSSDNTNTGAEVARWIQNNPNKKPKLVIIHTLNPPGQKYIKSCIPDGLVFPFAWTKINSEMLVDPRVIEVLKQKAYVQKI